MSADRHSYKARWVIPVEGEPIAGGIVEIDEGRITAIHGAHAPRAENLGNVALIPGLVNAHTHLEFSDLQEPLQPESDFDTAARASSPRPFPIWIRAVVAHRRTRSGPVGTPIAKGLRESARYGTTALGEIATSDWPPHPHSPGLRLVMFRELLGLRAEQIDEQLEIARRHLELKGDVVRGLSPHAPYSVHPELFRALVDLAAAHRAPVAVHLAETETELDLLADGTGDLARMLKEFGVWRDETIPRGTRPLEYLRLLAPLDQALVVHGNYLSREEIAFVARHPNLTVVYCPRTHAYFRHREHPWQELLEQGASVALGTDSRASNPDLSLWRELGFLRRQFPAVNCRTLLELGTINGARALGWEAETGSLTPGKSADLAVVCLAETRRGAGDAYATLFDARNRITATMCGGHWIG